MEQIGKKQTVQSKSTASLITLHLRASVLQSEDLNSDTGLSTATEKEQALLSRFPAAITEYLNLVCDYEQKYIQLMVLKAGKSGNVGLASGKDLASITKW